MFRKILLLVRKKYERNCNEWPTYVGAYYVKNTFMYPSAFVRLFRKIILLITP